MSDREIERFDRQFAALGWSYCPDSGEFWNGVRRLEWEHMIAALPALTFEQLMAYEDRKHDEWRRQVQR